MLRRQEQVQAAPSLILQVLGLLNVLELLAQSLTAGSLLIVDDTGVIRAIRLLYRGATIFES
jgi:hypothetical protein